MIDTDYATGEAFALGNFIAETIINYGNQDGSREISGYDNAFYQPVNEPLDLFVYNNDISLSDPNRWQPLTFESFIDQSGNLINGDTPEFFKSRMGIVKPFALLEENKTTYQDGTNNFVLYHDLGSPPLLNINNQTSSSLQYQWNFSLVSVWSAHLDPMDGVLWDISPNAQGNIPIASFPNNFEEYDQFYKLIEGGDIGEGRNVNPATNLPYEPEMVPRGDFTRVIAEFWADGPDSETPPGHWFTFLNEVSDHPLLDKKIGGVGEVVSSLEWDVKSYFLLGGAMHDAAITAWSIKGRYDYIRPISALRYMASLGQSTDSSLPNYHAAGIPLIPDYIEQIKEGDALAGVNDQNIGKIKLYAWEGHDQINDSATDVAGVGWILAENWFPYQRPSFVTPPFAGYVSGHSTFSRAAAEVMTLLTGDEYFPGGYGEFIARKNEFLVFEKGPSVDVKLQWATYRDASDQTSLSRIWGGIHPPADDILGRQIGAQIGVNAYEYGISYFNKISIPEFDEPGNKVVVFPNPTVNKEFNVANVEAASSIALFDLTGRNIPINKNSYDAVSKTYTITISNNTLSGLYILKIDNTYKFIITD